jgi:hypothetical protein
MLTSKLQRFEPLEAKTFEPKSDTAGTVHVADVEIADI